MDKLELKCTGDGSYTLYMPTFDETYHSIHGALQEARHVFIQAGFQAVQKDELAILEVGFGTGLNCILTQIENEDKVRVYYKGLEAYPVELSLIEKLDYPNLLSLNSEQQELFYRLHDSKWGEDVALTDAFILHKEQIKFEDFKAQECFDLIYFDAFGARIQPELWGEAMMQGMYRALKEEGCLVTYGAKGSFKRALKAVGFKVENLPGPPGKREMTRAWKK